MGDPVEHSVHFLPGACKAHSLFCPGDSTCGATRVIPLLMLLEDRDQGVSWATAPGKNPSLPPLSFWSLSIIPRHSLTWFYVIVTYSWISNLCHVTTWSSSFCVSMPKCPSPYKAPVTGSGPTLIQCDLIFTQLHLQRLSSFPNKVTFTESRWVWIFGGQCSTLSSVLWIIFSGPHNGPIGYVDHSEA